MQDVERFLNGVLSLEPFRSVLSLLCCVVDPLLRLWRHELDPKLLADGIAEGIATVKKSEIDLLEQLREGLGQLGFGFLRDGGFVQLIHENLLPFLLPHCLKLGGKLIRLVTGQVLQQRVLPDALVEFLLPCELGCLLAGKQRAPVFDGKFLRPLTQEFAEGVLVVGQ